jgi:hypothetical protein
VVADDVIRIITRSTLRYRQADLVELLVLDMDSSVSPTYGEQQGSA